MFDVLCVLVAEYHCSFCCSSSFCGVVVPLFALLYVTFIKSFVVSGQLSCDYVVSTSVIYLLLDLCNLGLELRLVGLGRWVFWCAVG